MQSFNLVDNPWIACIKDGQASEVSLKDALLHAHEINEITDNSPLVVVAIHRLLLAVLHRVFGPKDFDQWTELWKLGKWDAKAISEYLDRWKHRFDLFDKERPFYQSKQLLDENAEKKSIVLLPNESATSGTWCDHSFQGSTEKFSPAMTARYLLARQAFSLGGGNSKPFNLSNAPLAGGYTVMVLGNNLFETLALNLIPYNEESPLPQIAPDLPAWEQEQFREPDKNGNVPYGYVDYLTWQSRRILVFGDHTGVTDYALMQNLKLKDDFYHDPFKCYYKNPQRGMLEKKLNEDKVLWRDSHTLFVEAEDASVQRPLVFNHLAEIEKRQSRGELVASKAYRFMLVGLLADKAKVYLWSREVLPLPLVYLTDANLRNALKEAINLAEEVETLLSQAVEKLSATLLDERQNIDKDLVKKFAKGLGASSFYWTKLGLHFKQLLVDLPNDLVLDLEEETTIFGRKQLPLWAKLLEKTARQALRHVTSSLGSTAKDLKAVVQAESKFNMALAAVKKQYINYFDSQQTP